MNPEVLIERPRLLFQHLQRFRLHCGPVVATLYQHKHDKHWHCHFTRGFVVREETVLQFIAVAREIERIVHEPYVSDYQI